MVNSTLLQNSSSEMYHTMMTYKTVKLVRNTNSKYLGEKKEADTMTVCSTRDDIPTDLYILIRWSLVGTDDQLQTEMRSRLVDRTVSQNIMYAFKTPRQV